jgi:acyl phosphate:glycerol-3-phosphate acyltransferase
MNILLALLFSYLLGSIPAAYFAGKWIKGIDLRECGSGNLGFTNAWRNLGALYSIPVLFFDIAKGTMAVCLANFLVPENDWVAISAGLVAILGHNWTIFLGFKGGGKGVATSAGVFLALSPVPFLFTLFVFILLLAMTRIMSIASIMGSLTLVVSGSVMRWFDCANAPSVAILGFSILVATLIIIKHKSNIKRLLEGTEPKLGKNKEEASA